MKDGTLHGMPSFFVDRPKEECFNAVGCTIYIMYVRARTRDVMILLTSNTNPA